MYAALLDLKQMYNGCLAKSQAVVATKNSGQMLHMPECFSHISMGENFFHLENGASGSQHLLASPLTCSVTGSEQIFDFYLQFDLS